MKISEFCKFFIGLGAFAFLAAGSVDDEFGSNSSGYMKYPECEGSFKTDSNNMDNDMQACLMSKYARLERNNPIPVKYFAEEFENNSIVAEEKYEKTFVKLSGRIGSVDRDIADDVYVSVKGNEEYSFDSVKCDMMGKEQAARLRKGEFVTFYGFVKSSDFGVVLTNCYFQARNSPSPSRVLAEIRAETKNGTLRSSDLNWF